MIHSQYRSFRFMVLGLGMFLCLMGIFMSQSSFSQGTASDKDGNSAPSSKGVQNQPGDPQAPPRTFEINFDTAKDLKIRLPKHDLTPTPFQTPDDKSGWVVSIPGKRPIATPAYYEGLIFVGGGYGSHEFYAFKADTGEVAWKIQTKDDGPTAAVVEEGCVAFNTESCTIMVLEARTGKVLWEEWLGDPLMSQPAISKGRLYMAYPAGQRDHPLSQVQGSYANQQTVADSTAPRRSGHQLLCADLRTGKHYWEQSITADVIAAPVIDGDQVFFTCFDGTSFCLNALDGQVIWTKAHSGTSSPLVVEDQVVVTEKAQKEDQTLEGIRRLEIKKGQAVDQELRMSGKADYLRAGKGGGVAFSKAQQSTLDNSVGFGTAPAAANLKAASENVGVGSVAGGWAYQGSRAAYRQGRVSNAQGIYLNNMDFQNSSMRWRGVAVGKSVDPNDQLFTPPSMGKSRMYLATTQGHLLSVQETTGTVDFLYKTDHSMAFQPSLANGCMYVGTADGLLICLKTGDTDASDWHMWGGNAQHNKK